MAEDKPETDKMYQAWRKARAWVGRVTRRKAGWVSWMLAVALVLCGFAAAGLALHWYYLAVREAFGVAHDASLFGDAFGAFSALASALATIGVVGALLLQQKQLTLQREELRLQRDEMRAAREEHRKAAEAQAESARAARAQVAAFGAEGVERFITQARLQMRRLTDVATRIERRYSSLTIEHANLVNEVELPQAPIFCSSKFILQRARLVQIQIQELTETVRVAWEEASDARALDDHPEDKKEAVRAARQALEKRERLAREVSAALDALEVAAAEWFLRSHEPEPAQSGERPVTTPEEQAS